MINFYDYNGNQTLIDAISKEILHGWISKGKYQVLFEEEAKKILESKYVSGVSNGTIALQCAYQALELKAGDEILLPALGYMAAANVAILNGYNPVFIDVNPYTGNMDIESLELNFSTKTKAVVFIHNYGNSSGIKEIYEFCSKKKVKLIEDCAEGIFSKFGEKHIGNYGNIATYSFHVAKTITSGEGGLITTNDKIINDKISLLKDHGVIRHKGNPYYHDTAGSNYRISNLHSCIGYYSFINANKIIERKRIIYKIYNEKIKVNEKVHEDIESKNLFWSYPLMTKNLHEKIEVINKLKSLNIETRDCFVPVSDMKYYKKYRQDCVNAKKFSNRVVFLPSHHLLSDDNIETITSNINKIVC